MSEMIERVARAIYAVSEADIDWTEETYQAKNIVREEARAAIEAMREPTKEMLAAEGVQNNCYMCGGHVEGWQLMIDAALSSPDS